MKLLTFDKSLSQEVIELYKNVFSVAEGEYEGENIAGLVANLIDQTNEKDLLGFVAINNNEIVGCIFFSLFEVPSHQKAFILSPVAVATSSQGIGIGQKLISYGIDQMKSLKVDLLFTYGDPAYYAKVGFKQIKQATVNPPYPLSQPEGWLAQSLNGKVIETMQGNTKCVSAFNDVRYW